MPGATSVSYAVFEPFSKGLAGGSSERSDYGYPSSVVPLYQTSGFPSPGREIPAEQFEKLPVQSVLSLRFPHMKFGVPRIEATR
jgi:hypothetical protein